MQSLRKTVLKLRPANHMAWRYKYFSHEAATVGGSDRVVVLGKSVLGAVRILCQDSERLRISITSGGGWAGFNIALNANKDVPLTVVSPRNHFLFSPLLASTAVGTLEFRCIQEPIRTVLSNQGRFLQAKARSLDPVAKKIVCESVHNDKFELEYDKLVIAVGVKTNVSHLFLDCDSH